MKLEMHIDRDGKKYWVASQKWPDTPLRDIIVEAHSREGARAAFMETFGQQYAEAESHTGRAMMVEYL